MFALLSIGGAVVVVAVLVMSWSRRRMSVMDSVAASLFHPGIRVHPRRRRSSAMAGRVASAPRQRQACRFLGEGTESAAGIIVIWALTGPISSGARRFFV